MINTASVAERSVAIFNGGVGLSAVVGGRMAGANPIIAVDLDDNNQPLPVSARLCGKRQPR